MLNMFPIEVQTAHLKVLSAISSNLAAGFIILAFSARDAIILLGDILFVILCVIIAIKIEKILEGL